MAKREKFGKFVLLDEVESSGLGSEFRAAKLSNTGLEKVVALLRLSGTLSNDSEAAKALMDQTKIAAQLQNPNVVRIHGIGKVDWAYYISSEFIEGKSLKAIFKRCRQEGFPFSVDHALLIASKICSALEYAHGRKTDAGARYFHGLVHPGNVVVSYEGEVRTRGFGAWPARVREAGVLTPEDLQYLAPEQDAGLGDTKSDTYAVGAMLFEMLSGHPVPAGRRGGDAVALVAQARLQNPTGDDDALPKPLADILQRSLASEPGARYAEIQEMRKALDTLLFSGDFTPTTFNLAFFMHSLFREDIDRESKALKEEKEASYLEYLTDEPKTSPPRPAVTPVPAPPVPAATIIQPAPAAVPPPPPPAHAPRAEAVPEHKPAPHAPAPAEAGPGLTAKEAAAGFTFHKDEHKKAGSRAPLFAGLGVVVLLGAVGGYFLMNRTPAPPSPPPTTAPTTLSPEIEAQLARLKEYDDKLKAMEEEAKKKEETAKEDAKKRLEAQAKAKGEQLDPAALQKAQEEAAKKARAEQEKKAEEERKKLEEQKRLEEQRMAEQKKLEEQRAAEEKRKADEAAAAAATQPPATQPPPVIRAGTLVNLSDPGVTPPEAITKPQVQYPPIAMRQRVEGIVEMSVLIDDKGNVADAQVVRGAGGRAGLNEAAIDSVKKRKYRPASKEGVPVKVWISVTVNFQLPK